MDTTAPTKPTISDPDVDNRRVSRASLSFRGAAEAGTRVKLLLTRVTTPMVENELAEVTSDAGGNWSFAPSSSLVLVDGAYRLKVRSIDAADRSTESDLRLFALDGTGPETTIGNKPAALVNQTTANFTFTSEADATFECLLDYSASQFVPCSAVVEFANLAEGPHILLVRAKDTVGNLDPTPAVHRWEVDSTKPDAPLLTAPLAGASVATRQPTISGTAEPGSTVTIIQTVPSGAVLVTALASAGGSWSWIVTPQLTDGTTYTVKATATDKAGNVSLDSGLRSFTVDVTAPNTTLGSGPPALHPSTSATFTFSSIEPGATFKCSLDGGAFETCTSPLTRTVTNGPHTMHIRAEDAAGNVDPTPAVSSWTADAQSPAAPEINSPTEGLFVNTVRPLLQGSAEALSQVKVSLDGSLKATVTATAQGSWSYVPATDLSQGAHTASVVAVDAAGNTSNPSATRNFTVDTVLPETTITASPAPIVNQTTANFTFTSSKTGSTFECLLDTAPKFTECETPKSYTVTSGPHVLYVRAKDTAGNVDPIPAVHSWEVDVAAPAAPLVSAPLADAYVATRLPTISGTAEPGSTVTITWSSPSSDSVTGTAVASTGGSWSLVVTSQLTDGTTYTVKAKATDKAGNVGPDSAPRSFTVDVTAPDTILDSGPPPAQQSTTANFTFHSNETGGTFECSLDGAEYAACSSPHVATVASEGLHTLRIRAKDRAGNLDPSPVTSTWTVDQSAISTLITLMPPLLTNQKTGTFNFESNKTGATYDCSLDSSSPGNPTFVTCVTPYLTPALPDGSHTLIVRARDGAGNVDPTPESYTWTVDTTAPTTHIESGPTTVNGGTTNSPEARFTFSSNELNVTFLCDRSYEADDSSPGTSTGYRECPANHVLTNLLTGKYTLSVKAKDLAGNETETASPAVWTWWVNTKFPNTTLKECPPTGTPINTLTKTFTFTSDKDNEPPPTTPITFQCSLNGSTFARCDPTHSVTVVRDGSYTLRVKARDSLGNEDTEPAECTWTVDTQSPDTVLEQHPAAFEPKSLARFTFAYEGSELEAVHFECSLGSAPFTPCTSPFEVRDLADAAYTMNIRAVDAAGNLDGSPATASWVVDTEAPPVPVMTSPAPGAIVAVTTPVLQGSGEPGNRVSVALRNGPEMGVALVDAAGRWSLTPELSLPEGENALQLRAEDPAGNASGALGEFSLTVDTRSPETGIVAGPEGRVRTTKTTFQFSSTEEGATFECSLDNVEFAACESEISFDVLEGGHSLQVRSRDRAGNVDTSPETRQWRLSLGSDTRTLGGGVSCSSSSGGSLPFGMLVGLAVLALGALRRRRA
ncbi:Ig-like domain-containing protein [Corallococcus sicarius]|uniref:Ig-like domain-containing protein n=1 Tax=Corallococcus sicarius TaxID=2316726 RepID=UPI00131544A8|nr:Ig-like domain-containing protein [Corallococcus sicarius]